MVLARHMAIIAGLGAATSHIAVQIAAIEGCALYGRGELEVGPQAMTLAAEGRRFHEAAFAHVFKYAFMILAVTTAVNHTALRLVVHHRFFLMANQAPNVQLANDLFIIPPNDLGQLLGHLVIGGKQLGKMTLGAGKVGQSGVLWALYG